jgi:hypothetical protein
MKVCNTRQLVVLNERAHSLNYNRRLEREALGNIADPDGLHVLDSVMIHEHAQGQAVDPHYRCMVLIKVRNSTVPHEAWLDVPIEDYDKLAGTKEAAALQNDFVQKWNATL